jgi:hypothetical protein
LKEDYSELSYSQIESFSNKFSEALKIRIKQLQLAKNSQDKELAERFLEPNYSLEELKSKVNNLYKSLSK